MEHFSGYADYLRFSLAKGFSSNEAAPYHSFRYAKNRCEKVGNWLAKPILHPIDFSLRNGRNPLFITALTVGAIFMTTLLFYPTVFAGIFTATLAANIKAMAFIATQSAITGLGLRTLGRLNNRELMEKWDQHCLIPQRIGSLKI